jgi:hypothetical protein
MSDAKHTPGPWIVSRQGACDWSIRDARGLNVALLADADRVQIEANARLIAAAPKLWAFARDMAEGDCDYGDNCPGLRSNPRHGACHCCLAREALALVGGAK